MIKHLRRLSCALNRHGFLRVASERLEDPRGGLLMHVIFERCRSCGARHAKAEDRSGVGFLTNRLMRDWVNEGKLPGGREAGSPEHVTRSGPSPHASGFR